MLTELSGCSLESEIGSVIMGGGPRELCDVSDECVSIELDCCSSESEIGSVIIGGGLREASEECPTTEFGGGCCSSESEIGSVIMGGGLREACRAKSLSAVAG